MAANESHGPVTGANRNRQPSAYTMPRAGLGAGEIETEGDGKMTEDERNLLVLLAEQFRGAMWPNDGLFGARTLERQRIIDGLADMIRARKSEVKQGDTIKIKAIVTSVAHGFVEIQLSDGRILTFPRDALERKE